MNTPALPAPQRKVVLRLANSDGAQIPQAAPEDVEKLFRHAQALGLPLHQDPQVAALLASLRIHAEVPMPLYAAAAAVLAAIYASSQK